MDNLRKPHARFCAVRALSVVLPKSLAKTQSLPAFFVQKHESP